MHIHVERHLTRREGAIVSRHAAHFRTLTLTSQRRELIMDSIGFIDHMPFPPLKFFYAVVPGELDFQVVRKPDAVIPFFTPHAPPLLASNNHSHGWFSWNVKNVTTLFLKATLQHFEFEGWAPSIDVGPAQDMRPITFPMLCSLRFGYLDDISSLATCIVAPNLAILVLHDVLFCSTMLPYPADTPVTWCNLPRIFRALAPSSTRLSHLALVGFDDCSRDVVDMFFNTVLELTDLVLTLCHPSISTALFQPEARYCIPKAVLPKLSHLNTTFASPTDLARFLLRHKTVPVAPLKRLDVAAGQISAAHSRPGIRSILAVVLELNTKEGMRVFVVGDPKIFLIRPVASGS
ncbi:hypothetical protein DFH09DRAFT_1329509 [Mycena vulgaris]|nr:hypothetical protein DFH09DRAFT_1329509 [Mycena vulgaris]